MYKAGRLPSLNFFLQKGTFVVVSAVEDVNVVVVEASVVVLNEGRGRKRFRLTLFRVK